MYVCQFYPIFNPVSQMLWNHKPVEKAWEAARNLNHIKYAHINTQYIHISSCTCNPET